jgi:hypothetical protein
MILSRQIIRKLAKASVLAVLLLSGQVCPAQSNAPVKVLDSPVDPFRQMLTMSAAEQKSALALRPAEIRERLKQKLDEYQSLSPAESELRLRSTEMRWFVRPLMSTPATNREAQLKTIPAVIRGQVAARIEEWDRQSEASRQTLLVNPNALAYFTRWDAAEKAPRPLSDTEMLRRKLNASLKRFVELPAPERKKTLSEFADDSKRQQMEQTLQAFENLTEGQRERCIQSFAAFATMNEAERQEFLKNAESWSRMSSKEQDAWRALVSRAPIIPITFPRSGGNSTPTNGG